MMLIKVQPSVYCSLNPERLRTVRKHHLYEILANGFANRNGLHDCTPWHWC